MRRHGHQERQMPVEMQGAGKPQSPISIVRKPIRGFSAAIAAVHGCDCNAEQPTGVPDF